MSESILVERAGIFPCPNCRQMIYADTKKCRFCSASVDRQAAEQGADLQARVNTACNQAKMLRNAAGAMWIFFLIGLIPLLVPVSWGSTFLFYSVPASLIYWQVKFGRLKTDDKDYARAKRDGLTALLIWLPAMALKSVSIIAAFVR